MIPLIAIFYTNCFFITLVKGELVVERGPCAYETAVYRCNVHNQDLDWRWLDGEASLGQYVVIINLQPLRNTSSLSIRGIEVTLTITDFNLSSFISVVAVISNPEVLNGVTMTCGGQSLAVSVPQTSLVPAALKVLRIMDNSSEVHIQPILEGYSSNISYQLSSSDAVMPLSKSIILTVPGAITFLHCQYNGTFIIDACILEKYSQDFNYTLYSNGTWVISRRCTPPEIQVTCSNGSWSEDISCQELNKTSPSTSSELFQEAFTATSCEVLSTICSQQNQTSSYSANMYNVEVIIGSVIGTFVLALILGIILGLLCGFKLSKTNKTDKQSNQRSATKNLTKGPLYEEVEVEVDKNVELTTNISYDTIKI